MSKKNNNRTWQCFWESKNTDIGKAMGLIRRQKMVEWVGVRKKKQSIRKWTTGCLDHQNIINKQKKKKESKIKIKKRLLFFSFSSYLRHLIWPYLPLLSFLILFFFIIPNMHVLTLYPTLLHCNHYLTLPSWRFFWKYKFCFGDSGWWWWFLGENGWYNTTNLPKSPLSSKK